MKIKRISLIIILMLLILFIKTESKATIENNQTEVKLITNATTIEKDVPIQVQIYIKNNTKKIQSIDVLLDYNTELFYDLQVDDFVENVDMYIFDYVSADKNLQISMNEGISEGVIATINITPKTTITETDTKVTLLKMYDMYIVAEDFTDEEIYELESAIWTIGKEENLYLSSEIYKIGNNDIKNYEEGDKYISRVNSKTTVTDFIKNLDTNGTIKVTKEDGTEVTQDEYIGTGMTLEVSKDEEKIVLQIAVSGDLNGDGKVTVTDLSKMNQTLLETVTLENEYKIAADLDENDKISVTDLSMLNKILLQEL